MSFFLLHRALNLHFSNSYTHQTLHLFPCLYPEGFLLRDLCNLLDYLQHSLPPQNCDKNEIPKIPSFSKVLTVMSKK